MTAEQPSSFARSSITEPVPDELAERRREALAAIEDQYDRPETDTFIESKLQAAGLLPWLEQLGLLPRLPSLPPPAQLGNNSPMLYDWRWQVEAQGDLTLAETEALENREQALRLLFVGLGLGHLLGELVFYGSVDGSYQDR